MFSSKFEKILKIEIFSVETFFFKKASKEQQLFFQKCFVTTNRYIQLNWWAENKSVLAGREAIFFETNNNRKKIVSFFCAGRLIALV